MSLYSGYIRQPHYYETDQMAIIHPPIISAGLKRPAWNYSRFGFTVSYHRRSGLDPRAGSQCAIQNDDSLRR